MIELKALIIDKPENKAFHTNQAPGIFKPMITALRTGGVDATCIAPQDESDIVMAVEKGGTDIVFCAAYGIPTADGKMKNAHLILDELQVPYIGSPAEILDIAINKPKLKSIWHEAGIRTPGFQEFTCSKVDDFSSYSHLKKYPYIIKPSNAGNSRGINQSSIVKDINALENKISELLPEFEDVIAEEYLGEYPDFQEVTVAWIGNDKAALIMPTEIHLSVKSPFPVISTQVKDGHLTHTSQVEDDTLWREIHEFARKAFAVAGVRDYARLDLIRADGKLHAIEINGQPMVPDRWFEACSRSVGLNQDQYINAIFLAGIIRNMRQGMGNIHVPYDMQRMLPKSIYQLLTMNA